MWIGVPGPVVLRPGPATANETNPRREDMRRVLAGIGLFGAAVLWGADKYQPLNVKLGLWETTSTITTKGQVPVSDEMLSRLTPEQRARVEERMKAQAGDRTTTHTYKSCLTKEKLERGSGF